MVQIGRYATCETPKRLGSHRKTTGEPLEIERLTSGSEGGGWKSVTACRDNSLAAYPTPVRFDERGVETGHGKASEAPANERAGNR